MTEFETLSAEGTPFQSIAFRRLYETARVTPFPGMPAMRAAYQACLDAWAEGAITDAQAAYLDPIFRNRLGNGSPTPSAGTFDRPAVPRVRSPESQVGSRPRGDGSLTRRRQFLAIGLLPDRFLTDRRWGIYACLAAIAKAVVERGRCALYVGQIGAAAGYCESTVQAAIRHGRDLGWLKVEYRRRPGALRNDASVITITDSDWLAWLKHRAATWRRMSRAALAFWGLGRDRGDRDRAPFVGDTGSKLARATRTRDLNGDALARVSTVTTGARGAEGAADGRSARRGPARPPRHAPA